MTTPSANGPIGSSGRVDRIRRRLIWALLGPFGILMSVATIAGFAPVDPSRATTAIIVLVVAAVTLPVAHGLARARDPARSRGPRPRTRGAAASFTARRATKR